jgi:hypothetical protein
MFGYSIYLYIFVADNINIKSNQKRKAMKNTDLEVREDKTRKAIFLLILAVMPVIMALISCATPTKQTASKQEQFKECSKDQGDAGCDSCYFAIYGYHINPYTGEKINL